VEKIRTPLPSGLFVFSKAGLVGLLILVSCHAPDDFTAARSAREQYHADKAAVADPLAQQDPAVLQQRQDKANDSLKQAILRYEQAGAIASKDARVLREYAEMLSAAGDYDLASEVWRRLTNWKPDDASAWKELGRNLSAPGHFRAQEALVALRRALELSPEGDTHFLMGRIYRQEGLSDLAAEAFGKALENDPAHWGARVAMAALKIETGRVREGNSDLETLGAPPPEYADEYTERIKEAVDRLLDARRILPDTAEDAMAYAKVMLRAQRLQDAMEAAERSARLAPNDETVFNFIGDVAVQLGLRDRARKAYVRSLELKGDQPRTIERMQAIDSPAK